MWAFAVVATWANSGGKIGVSEVGCTCHALAPAGTVDVAFSSPVRVGPGSTVDVVLEVSTTDPDWTWAGLNVACSDGTLLAGFNTDLSNGEITHGSAQPLSNGAISFEFQWEAPLSDGTVTCTGVANTVNLNGTTSGDGYAFAPDLVIEVDSACTDLDGDGVDTCNGDCDDAEASVYTGAPELCDVLDNDCDGTIDDDPTDQTSWYLDADGDGFGIEPATVACDPPAQHVDLAGDCNDANASVSPAAPEVCDPSDVDEDCDDSAEEADAVGIQSWYPDEDSDGYGAGAEVIACDPPPDHAALDGDCRDNDPAYNPGAPEADCNDPEDYNCDGSTGFADSDGDGFAACVECDDADAGNNPAAAEVCDGEDDDCDGQVDEPDALDALVFYRDADLDGHGTAAETTAACSVPDGYSVLSDDCDDDDDTVFPGSAEVWYDGVDADCSGSSDFDQDGDGVDRDPPGEDCDDTDPNAYPGAPDPALDCVDDPVTDGDGTDVDAGDDEEPPAPPETGCGCDSGAAGGLLPLLLGIPALGRRRRA